MQQIVRKKVFPGIRFESGQEQEQREEDAALRGWVGGQHDRLNGDQYEMNGLQHRMYRYVGRDGREREIEGTILYPRHRGRHSPFGGALRPPLSQPHLPAIG